MLKFAFIDLLLKMIESYSTDNLGLFKILLTVSSRLLLFLTLSLIRLYPHHNCGWRRWTSFILWLISIRLKCKFSLCPLEFQFFTCLILASLIGTFSCEFIKLIVYITLSLGEIFTFLDYFWFESAPGYLFCFFGFSFLSSYTLVFLASFNQQ